jgi:hypothetical protein
MAPELRLSPANTIFRRGAASQRDRIFVLRYNSRLLERAGSSNQIANRVFYGVVSVRNGCPSRLGRWQPPLSRTNQSRRST